MPARIHSPPGHEDGIDQNFRWEGCRRIYRLTGIPKHCRRTPVFDQPPNSALRAWLPGVAVGGQRRNTHLCRRRHSSNERAPNTCRRGCESFHVVSSAQLRRITTKTPHERPPCWEPPADKAGLDLRDPCRRAKVPRTIAVCELSKSLVAQVAEGYSVGLCRTLRSDPGRLPARSLGARAPSIRQQSKQVRQMEGGLAVSGWARPCNGAHHH